MKYAGTIFKRNRRGGLMAPHPGAYIDGLYRPLFSFAEPPHGYPPAIAWRERQTENVPAEYDWTEKP